MAKLSRGASKMVDQKVQELFERLKYRILGPHATGGRHLYVGFKRPLSLPGIFEQAVTDEGGYVDRELVERLMEVTSDFLDKHQADAKAQIKKKIADILQEVEDGKREATSFRSVLDNELWSTWRTVKTSIQRVVETQNQHAQTIGLKDGIDQVNARLGIQDAIVFFAPVKDDRLCDECRRLHLLQDGVTPRVWRSSEVGAGYHKRGTEHPSWSLLHPHCRCALTTLLPGYGFDAAGRVMFKELDWDELKHQRES